MEQKQNKTLKKSVCRSISIEDLSILLKNCVCTDPDKKKEEDSKLEDKKENGQSKSTETNSKFEKIFDDGKEVEPTEGGSKQNSFASEGILKCQPNLPTTSVKQPGDGNGGAIPKRAVLDLNNDNDDDYDDYEEYEGAHVKFMPSELCSILEERCIITKQMYGKFLMEKEKERIEYLYSEQGTTVVISKSAASVYLCAKNLVWMELFYGVPVAILSTAGPNPKLSLIITERATGFELCRETIDWKSGYARENSTDYSLIVCHEHSSKMEIHFEDEIAGTDFWVQMSLMTSKLENFKFDIDQNSLDKWVTFSTPSVFKHCSTNCFYQLNGMRPDNFNIYLSQNHDFL